MRVLVTGGLGFIGRTIVRQLVETGHDTVILSRQGGTPPAERVAVRVGSVLDVETVGAAMQGIEAVIHLVGIIAEVRDHTYNLVHAEGTRNVLRAAESSGVGRVLHMSALGSRPAARSRYHQSKWEAEAEVRNSKLSWTIFRPSVVYGAEDQFTRLLARMVRLLPLVPILGPGSSLLQPISVEDTGRAFVRSLNSPGSVGQTYDLCGKERFTFNALVDEIAVVLGRKVRKVHVPMGIARLQGALFEWVLGSCVGVVPPFNRDQLLMLEEDNVGDPEPARAAFELELQSFRSGLEHYLPGIRSSQSSPR